MGRKVRWSGQVAEAKPQQLPLYDWLISPNLP